VRVLRLPNTVQLWLMGIATFRIVLHYDLISVYSSELGKTLDYWMSMTKLCRCNKTTSVDFAEMYQSFKKGQA